MNVASSIVKGFSGGAPGRAGCIAAAQAAGARNSGGIRALPGARQPASVAQAIARKAVAARRAIIRRASVEILVRTMGARRISDRPWRHNPRPCPFTGRG
jgi:hypothetical protein